MNNETFTLNEVLITRNEHVRKAMVKFIIEQSVELITTKLKWSQTVGLTRYEARNILEVDTTKTTTLTPDMIMNKIDAQAVKGYAVEFLKDVMDDIAICIGDDITNTELYTRLASLEYDENGFITDIDTKVKIK